MSLVGHGDRKYTGSQRLSDLDEYTDLHLERRQLKAGLQSNLELECIVIAVAGRSMVRRTGDGDTQQTYAQRGTAWICPAGIYERDIDLSEPLECLHIFLPSTLIMESALADYNIDPAHARLAYAGGLVDPMIYQIGTSLSGLFERDFRRTDRLFLDGMRTVLAAYLLEKYAIDRWQPPAKAPELDPKRLKRVVDYIEVHLAEEITLDSLARKACLSPYHFSRLFRDATGDSPHRYVTGRRVEAARQRLAHGGYALVEIALDLGFGSQDNFTRVFRKVVGLTPGQYRELGRR